MYRGSGLKYWLRDVTLSWMGWVRWALFECVVCCDTWTLISTALGCMTFENMYCTVMYGAVGMALLCMA